MQLSEKQAEAARANGQKSRGPVTPEGKRISSGNSLRHGLLARTVVFDGESRERFNALLKAFCDELQPETPIEDLLIQKMAVNHWRQERIWSLEKTRMSRETQNAAHAAPLATPLATEGPPTRAASEQNHSNSLMNLYEMRFDRQFGRALDRFLKYRAARKTHAKCKSEQTTPAN